MQILYLETNPPLRKVRWGSYLDPETVVSGTLCLNFETQKLFNES